jgi:hypothetical protein
VTKLLRHHRRLLCAHIRRVPVIFMLIVIAFSRDVLGQNSEAGAIKGQVTDSWQGSPVPAVIVTVRGTTLGAETDGAGNYLLPGVPAGSHTLILTKNGYERVIIDNVKVVPGITTDANAKLGPIFFELDAFEAVTEPIPEQKLEIFAARKNASVVVDALGAEDFSRLGVSDAAGAVSKVTGVTIKDGKYAVVRGLSDRYTSSSMNGAEIPSADPDRQAAQLDLFPSAMIERVEVKKTFSPDQPGGFTGGAINIVTKSFPDRFIFNYGVGFSYNEQSNLREDFLSSTSGGHDFLGFDDGSRGLPSELESPNFSQINTDIAFGQLFLRGIPVPTFKAAFDRNNALANSFGDSSFAPTAESSPLNHNFNLSFGDRKSFFGKQAGFFAGLSYDHSYRAYQNRVRNRFAGSDPTQAKRALLESKGSDSVAWGASFAAGIEPSETHELGFTFAYTQNTDDDATITRGRSDQFPDVLGETIEYNERYLRSYQLKGVHEFPELRDIKFEWLTSIASTAQDVPDLRLIEGVRNSAAVAYQTDTSSSPQKPQRQFRNTQEGNFNNKLDLTLPFTQWTDDEGALKFGLYQSIASRDFAIRGFELLDENDQVALVNGSPDPSLSLIRPIPGNFADSEGERTIEAGYAMAELPFWSRVKGTGGVRYESTLISMSTRDQLDPTTSGSTTLQQANLLPAAGLIISPTKDIKVNLNWSETIARPSFRELTPVPLVTTAGGRRVFGSADLDLTTTVNYDLRVEWLPDAGEVYSAGVFYKEITGPIEQVLINSEDDIQYRNGLDATLFGVECEVRRNLGLISDSLDAFEVGVNYAFLLSDIQRTPLELSSKAGAYNGVASSRPMFDQPSYVLNADITHDSKLLDMVTTVSFNVSGRRLVLVNSRGPDSYLEPVPSLDLSLTKRWKIKFSAKNLLNPLVKEVFDEDEVRKVIAKQGSFLNDLEPIASAYRRGRTFGMSLSYSF